MKAGGSAFPCHPNSEIDSPYDGMTLRDYFAAKAMLGYAQYRAANSMFVYSNDELAKESYEIADAMLKARQ